MIDLSSLIGLKVRYPKGGFRYEDMLMLVQMSGRAYRGEKRIMKQRRNVKLEAGQIWQSSDPRRLRAFVILAVHSHVAEVRNIYPLSFGFGYIDRINFARLGSKGYTRMK